MVNTNPIENYRSDDIIRQAEFDVVNRGINENPVGGRKKYKGKKFTSKKTKGKKSKTKKTKTKKNKGKAGAWILHVKSFAKARGLNFPEALKHPDCKKTYKK